jgi:hypothetical protein
MKKLLIVLSSFLLFIVHRSSTSAHLPGQPPFFKVNGVYSAYYPVSGTSLEDFILPQDIAVDKYVINEEIVFEIEREQLPVPQEIVEKTKFVWKFGDGTEAEGLINNHVYTKPGSYILFIYADTSSFEKGVEPQLIQSTLINVFSKSDDEAPRAVIKINNRGVTDPSAEWLTFNPGEKLTFDASNSSSARGITEYIWDFGDGSSATGRVVTHTYKDIPLVLPVLRIKTADGFIADNFVEVQNIEDGYTQSKDISTEDGNRNSVILKNKSAILSILVVVSLVSVMILLKRKKK